MALRPSTSPELTLLVRALRARIESLGSNTTSTKDGLEIFCKNDQPFLQLEVRRDHMNLDLWLSAARLEEARASGIARSHPFLPEAVKVRFERAEDLTRVASWLEESYKHAVARGRAAARKEKADAAPKAAKSSTRAAKPAKSAKPANKSR